MYSIQFSFYYFNFFILFSARSWHRNATRINNGSNEPSKSSWRNIHVMWECTRCTLSERERGMVQKSGLPAGHTVLHQSIIIGLRLQSFISPYCNKNYWKESFTSFKNTAAVSGIFSFFSYPVTDIRFGIRRTFVDYITHGNLIIFFVYLITYLLLRPSGLLLRFTYYYFEPPNFEIRQ